VRVIHKILCYDKPVQDKVLFGQELEPALLQEEAAAAASQ